MSDNGPFGKLFHITRDAIIESKRSGVSPAYEGSWYLKYRDDGGRSEGDKKAQRDAGRRGRAPKAKGKAKYDLSSEDIARLYDERNRLEEEIMDLISGGTGMRDIWEKLVECAGNAAGVRFLFLGRTFPELTRRLSERCGQLMDIIQMGRERTYAPSVTAASLFAPYPHQAECERLIRCGEYLTESGLTERETVTPEELRAWLGHLPEESDSFAPSAVDLNAVRNDEASDDLTDALQRALEGYRSLDIEQEEELQ